MAKDAQEIKSITDLKNDVIEKRKELIDLKRHHASGELANPRAIKAVRKEIARLETAVKAASISEQKENN